MPDTPLDLLRSALAGRYDLQSEIGRGGMALVYRARDLKHDRDVAVKVMRPELVAAVGMERFEREVRIEAQLHHPNVLALFDSGRIEQTMYCVMPFAEGGSLRDRLTSEPQLPLDDALRIVSDVGEALGHAHGMGIIHRDVKPENILISGGRAMLADFGIARAAAEADPDELTESGIALGTPSYMSPEQAAGTRHVDHRSDLYSLGCVLYEMLAGDPPFTGRNPRAILARQMQEPPPSLEVVRPDVPPHVTSAITTSLAKAPAGRHRNVTSFLKAMEWAERPVVPARSRGRRLTAGIVAAAALAAGALGWWLHLRAPVLSPDKVAVFPLSARGVGRENTDVGVGVSYLIEAGLEHAEPLRLIDMANHLTEQQRLNPESIAARDATRLARSYGAAFYLRGVVQGHGDSTTLILQLYDVAGDSLVIQRSATGASVAVPLHHLGLDALKALLPTLIDPEREFDLTALRDRQTDAIALWMQGEREYRLAKFSPALALYERALAVDSALALAAIKGAQAAHWTHNKERGRTLIRLALARDSLLPNRYAVFARGLAGYFEGHPDTAVTWLRRVVDIDPDWAEAWMALGEVFRHLLPSATDLNTEAQTAFNAALASDSGFTPPLYHLSEARLWAGDVDRARALLDRFSAMEPDPRLSLQLALMLDCVSSPATMDWPQRVSLNSVSVLMAAKSLTAAASQYECAEGAYRALLADSTTSRGERWGAFLGLQSVLVATGRDAEATELIDSASVRTGAARSLYVLDAAAGADMSDGATALETFARERYGPAYETLGAAEPLWVMAVWHYMQGDRAGLATAAQRLATIADASVAEHERVFAWAATALTTLASDTAHGTEPLPAFPTDVGTAADLEYGFGIHLAPIRLWYAQSLFARGAYRESLAAASVFDHPQPILFVPYVPLSLALRYRAATALGDNTAAAAYRGRLQRLNRTDLIDPRN